MRLKEFDYNLPKELIAQRPIKKRDESRLLVLDRKSGEIKDLRFKDIVNFLGKGDLLVLNDTKVIPARLIGKKRDTGDHIEVLLLRKIERDLWEVLIKPGKRVKKGIQIVFGEGLSGEVIDRTDFGTRLIRFYYRGRFDKILDKIGKTPLPPYIKNETVDRESYQTIYAKRKGASACPTAGLHFTRYLLKRIEDIGVNLAFITLHTGLGTFRPVKCEDIQNHHMHPEYYEVREDVAKGINDTMKRRGRIIACGTTVVRTLETVASINGVKGSKGWTDLFIYPGFRFQIVDCLITNFHLPKSTLLMLVSAFAGMELIKTAYLHAIKNNYRFYSFGDAMLII
ncbi:MAG: tRNA preQ1(34) S-adenosylmethionine ribosyltransferase-isomerase QueA [bacterium]|nr:tRNA preQ1(34) S-adenosylmethionine ribosyltransferase-isomerase QueA [bacterium]